MQQKGFLVKTW